MKKTRHILLFLPWLYVLGYVIWQCYTPVAVYVQAHDWSRTHNGISASLMGWKLHRCALVKNSGRGYIQIEGRWISTEFHSEPANDGNHLGLTHMGRWSWNVPSDSSGFLQQVRAAVQYSCSGELQELEVGPLIIKGFSEAHDVN